MARPLGRDYEIILVNDGSRDATGELARARLVGRIPGFVLIEHSPNRGYGGALKAGFAVATKEVVAFTAADRQFDFREVTRLLDALTPDVALVSGRRLDRRDRAMRRLNGMGWNLVVTALFGRSVSDIDCGFKVFRREVLPLLAGVSAVRLAEATGLSRPYCAAILRGKRVAHPRWWGF